MNDLHKKRFDENIKNMQERHNKMMKKGLFLILLNIIIGAGLFVGALYLIKYLFF